MAGLLLHKNTLFNPNILLFNELRLHMFLAFLSGKRLAFHFKAVFRPLGKSGRKQIAGNRSICAKLQKKFSTLTIFT